MFSLEKKKKMDPFILLSAINMQLRDNYPSLEDLCKSFDIDEEKLKTRLNNAGFTYDKAQNQFK